MNRKVLFFPRRYISTVFFILLAASLGYPAAKFRLSGTVKDPSGAVVPSAKVTLQGRAEVQRQTKETDQQGRFNFADLEGATQRITILANGFKPYVHTWNSLNTSLEFEVNLEFAALQTNMVVSATRTETPAESIGSSVTLISKENLDQSRSASVLESLRDVPGFVVLQTGGRGGVTSLFSRGGESDFNKVLYDGFPLNDLGGVFNFAHLTTFNVERVEALHGPSSALFGSDAIASVVQVFSQKGATTRPALDLQVEGGSYGLAREAASFSGLFSRLDYSASVENWNSGGRYVNDDYRNTVFGGNFGWQLSGRSSLRTTIRYGTS
jgi:vitamin B12 transporter